MPSPLLYTDCLAVNTRSQLLALTAASTPFPRLDGMWLLVREEEQFYLYSQSATTGGLSPSDSTGRWFPFGGTPSPIWSGTSLGWDTTGDGNADTTPVNLQGATGAQGIQGIQGPPGESGGTSTLQKANPAIPAFEKTAAYTARTNQEIIVKIGASPVTIPALTSISLPASPVAGTDYTIWAETGGTVAGSTSWATPPSTGAVKIGGFHYAPGGNADPGVREGGNTTPQINECSFWDLNFRPDCDPRGMAFVGGINADGYPVGSYPFWVDIYLLNTNPDVHGTSRNNTTIFKGGAPCIIPARFNGDGTATYTCTAYNAWRTLQAYGKRPLTWFEFQAAAFGVWEMRSRSSDPVTTGYATTNTSTNPDHNFTSIYGLIQISGTVWQWGADHGSNTGGSASNTTESQGLTWGQPLIANFGAAWLTGGSGGSRSFNSTGASAVVNFCGARGAADHFQFNF